ncbi:class D sortase [Radiobacillus sp. PE A8.2]|uniref:class D sortase n=1 Tax=Radiobacillus sp. PE A8.2 TaxID=3380349 RepID=UPI00388F6292
METSIQTSGDEDIATTQAQSYLPVRGETVGIIQIPSINTELPILEGTEADELVKGVGHYIGSAFPSENDQIVLSGHRDTVFRNLGKVKVGDIFIIKMPYGEFTYKMVDYKIVEADDRTVIKSTAPEETLILTTCYPFGYIGDAPQRYIVYAKPVIND